MFSHVGNDLLTQLGSRVEHCHYDSAKLQSLVRA
jgi:hypothetical protein